MDIKLLTPVQVFINGKFFCIADTVEMKKNSPKFKRSILPDNPKTSPGESNGTVVNIIRKPRTKEEIKEVEAEKKKGTYDEFFRRSVDAIRDPEVHIPVDTSDI